MLPSAALLLNHRQPQIWQLFTSCFTHPSLESLMQCVFFTYIFGRVVERNHGSLATWAVYISCGAGACQRRVWSPQAPSQSHPLRFLIPPGISSSPTAH